MARKISPRYEPITSSPGTMWSMFFSEKYLGLLREHLGPDITVKELQIYSILYLAPVTEGEELGVSEIAERLDLPKSTVSRIIIDMLSAGRLEEVEHADGRRRPLAFRVGSIEARVKFAEGVQHAAYQAAKQSFGSIRDVVKGLMKHGMK